MKKLYEKSEITFAILWIVLYTVGMGNLRSLGDDSPYMMAGLIVISAAMFLFVKLNGLEARYGLDRWAADSRSMLWFIPLWIIALSNLASGISPGYPLPGVIFAVISMALVGFAEEMIFRGFLFNAMLKDGNARTAVIVCAVSFGLGHILNIFTGHDLIPTLIQVVFAVSVGFVYTLSYYRCGSLLPCILSHSLTDVFAVLGSDDASFGFNMFMHAVVIVICIIYSIYLAKKSGTSSDQ